MVLKSGHESPTCGHVRVMGRGQYREEIYFGRWVSIGFQLNCMTLNGTVTLAFRNRLPENMCLQCYVNTTVEKGIYLLSCTFPVLRKYQLMA